MVYELIKYYSKGRTYIDDIMINSIIIMEMRQEIKLFFQKACFDGKMCSEFVSLIICDDYNGTKHNIQQAVQRIWLFLDKATFQAGIKRTLHFSACMKSFH